MRKTQLTLDELKERDDITVLDEHALKKTEGSGPIDCLVEYIDCVAQDGWGCGFDLWACMNG